jgi:MFS family permease
VSEGVLLPADDGAPSWREARHFIDKATWFLLIVLGVTSFFDGFDRSVLNVALPQIRADFDLSQGQASLWISLLYLGALPALFITRYADKVGRRKLLMVSIIGYTVATVATSVAPTIEVFVATQFVARLFLNAEAALVWTFAAEELPAKVRGFGLGWLAMNSALGHGIGSLVYGTFFEPVGISWRWMYVVGMPPLLLVGWLRRRLPESRRFTAAKAAGHLARRWQEIFGPQTRRWLLLLIATAFLTELTTQASVFMIDFLQEDRGLSSMVSNLMLVVTGLPGIPAMMWAGSFSDKHGRRLVGCAFAGLAVVGTIGFFWLPGGVLVLGPMMALTLIGTLGAWPVLGAYATELFPTSMRGQAGSWATVARVSGQSASFAMGGVLIGLTGSLSGAATVLSLGPILAVVIIALTFPDTHGRELEEISGEELIGLDMPFVAETAAIHHS